MKRISLLLAFGLPLAAQWTVYDPTNWAVNSRNVQQAIQTYQAVMQYKQIAENMAAFAHHPAQFLAYMSGIEQTALNTAASAGVTTSQRAAQLQELIRLQQQAMQEAQTISTISNSNMGSIGQWAVAIQDTSQALAATRAQLLHEQRVAYYRDRSTYQPQAQIISNWRLK